MLSSSISRDSEESEIMSKRRRRGGDGVVCVCGRGGGVIGRVVCFIATTLCDWTSNNKVMASIKMKSKVEDVGGKQDGVRGHAGVSVCERGGGRGVRVRGYSFTARATVCTDMYHWCQLLSKPGCVLLVSPDT